MATEKVNALVIGKDNATPALESAGKSADKMGNKFSNASKKLDAAGKKMQSVGKGATRNLTAPIVALGTLAAREFAKFDDAMTKSTAIMSGVNDEMRAEMEKTAKDMSTKYARSAEDLAESYYFLASAGLDAKQSIAALPAVTEFATAGAFDMARATDLLTDAQSALGLTVKDSEENLKNMTRVSDLFVKANTLANASVEQFSESITNEAGVAMRQYGIQLEDGIATLAAFADQGIKGNVSGSLFGRAIRLLTKAATDNAEEFKRMNIAVFDSEGNFRKMSDISADLENALNGMSTETRAAALETLGFQARTQQAILPLVGMSEKIAEYEEKLKSAGGTTEQVANKQMESFGVQMKKTWIALKNLSAGIFEQLEPAVRKIGDAIVRATEKFNSLSDRTKKIIALTAVVVAAIGPVLIVFGTLARSVAAIISVAKIFIGLAPAITGVFAGIKTAILALSGPIGWVIGAVGLLSVAISKNWLGLGDFAKKAWKGITNTVKEAAEKTKDFWALSWRDKLQVFKIGALGLGKIYFAFQKDMLGNVVVTVKKIPQLFKWMWEKASQVDLKPLWENFKSQAGSIARGVSKWAGDVWHNIKAAFTGGDKREISFGDIFKNMGKGVSKTLEDILGQEEYFENTKKAISEVGAEMNAILEKGNELRSKTATTADGGQLAGLSEEMEEQKKAMVEEYKNLSIESSESIADATQQAFETEKEVFAEKREELSQTGKAHTDMVTSLKDANTNMVNSIQTTVSQAIKLYEQLRQTLLKIKAITAPAEGPDKRSIKDVATQFGVTDPTVGAFSTANSSYAKASSYKGSSGRSGAGVTTSNNNDNRVQNNYFNFSGNVNNKDEVIGWVTQAIKSGAQFA